MDWTSPESYHSEPEWRMLLVPSKYGMGYPNDFDRNKEYEFCRHGSEEVEVFRLADCSPYFNVAGLMWRKPNPAARRPKP